MLNYIDLFCGAGGFSKGFDEAGFQNLFSIEYDKEIAKTYQRNFSNHLLICEDIRQVSEDLVREILDGRNVDVVIGGSPCQGFSKAGNPGRTFVDDERNYLFKEYVRMLSITHPKIFVFENVAALKNHRNGKSLQEILDAFSKEQYRVQYQILNAADYGIAQERRRIFIVGIRNDLDISFLFPPKEKKIRTVYDAIHDLPPLGNGESSAIPNHNSMRHSVQMLEKMSYVKDGGDRSQIPESIRPKTGDARKYIRYDSKKPSVCVTGDMRKIFHYSQNRALTPRELARLQSFSDDFVFEGSSICIQQQIGNAVPPVLAKKIAIQVMKAINE